MIYKIVVSIVAGST